MSFQIVDLEMLSKEIICRFMLMKYMHNEYYITLIFINKFDLMSFQTVDLEMPSKKLCPAVTVVSAVQ